MSWNDEYNGEYANGDSWSIEIDGKKSKGSNAFPQNWEELIDAIYFSCTNELVTLDCEEQTNGNHSCTNELATFNLLNFLGYKVGSDYYSDNILEFVKDEHPQTYYRGASIFKKGNVVGIDKVNIAKTVVTVIGSQGNKYNVEICKWQESMVDTYQCSCPSTQPICKHIVAAVMAVQKESLLTRYHDAVKNGTLIGEFEINDDDLERLALLVDESIVNLRRKDFVGISVCEKFIESVAETLNEDCRRVMQGLDWYGMAIVPWFPRLKMQELSWGLRAIISQVRSPSMDTEARRFYEKVKNGELITDETRARDRGRMRYCPLMGKEITDEVCFDINMHVDEGAPKRTVPKEILSVEGYKEICLKCEKHGNE